MKNKPLSLIYFIFCVYISPQVLAEKLKKKEPENMVSLFLPPGKTHAINSFSDQENYGNPSFVSSTQETKVDAIYLGTLFFQTPSKWALWVNGTRIMSDEDIYHKLPQGLTIEEVDESYVVFCLKLDPHTPEKHILLHPNQTYFVGEKEICEGDKRSARRQE